MPAARLLALAPAPGQHLQLLRSASSASSASSATSTTSTSSSSSVARRTKAARQEGHAKDRHARTRTQASAPSAQPSWCRGASPAVGLFRTRPTATTAVYVAAAATNAASRCARIQSHRHHHHQSTLPATTRPFGSATMPKQVAFPRHGKAVAPLTPDTGKPLPAQDSDSTQTAQIQASGGEGSTPAEAAAETAEKQPAKKTSRRAKTNKGSVTEAPIAAAAATAASSPTDASQTQTSSSPIDSSPEAKASPADAPPAPEPPTVKVDAQGALGRSDGSSTNGDPTDPASIAADAAAASVTAAETASVVADIVKGADPVIELGPPKVTIGANLAPNAGQQDGPNQSEQQQQQQTAGQMASSSSSSSSARQPLSQNKLSPPHLAPPLYVHHFDSYSLVKQLEDGGYRREQAVTAMKAVRSLLAQHLDVAQSSLVSKSDVENEAYLFKAACAELSIEVRNNRRRADELVRQQRSLLQHEVDIAAQSVNQELLTLADVVKELFNDRKMAVREEQKALESAIQQLSYKITIMLNSEMRSEIEGLRWVLIRRSVLGIIFMAILTLGTLRYASYISHEKQRAAERALREAREAEAQRFADTRIDTSSPPDAAEILAAN